ncbi:MAG: hypothetical protein Fur0018_04020 [Anaerolineales bacterium]
MNDTALPDTLGEQIAQHRIPTATYTQQFLALPPRERLDTMTWLKEQSDRMMRTDLQACLQLCRVMKILGEASGDARLQALALLACANAHAIGQGNFQRGLEAYQQAGELYASLNEPIEQARSVIGKLYALANLGEYERALAEAEWAREILRKNREWLTLARLKVNMALLHSRLGNDSAALALLDLAKAAYRRLGIEGEAYWPRLEHNRAIVLRNLGRFDEALRAATFAWQEHRRLGQTIAAARALQNLAVTRFVMGEYNQALDMLIQARDTFASDNRTRHTLLVDLAISDCLLYLRQYDRVITCCTQAHAGFSQLGNHYEAGQALLRVGRAHLELGEFPQALEALQQAHAHLETEDNRTVLADLDMQLAELYLRQGHAAEARLLAEACAAVYQAAALPIPLGNAWHLAAQAALSQRRVDTARAYLAHLQAIITRYNWPNLRYRAAWLESQLAGMRGDMPAALEACARTIDDLERTCNALMLEHRAAFLEDKKALYENAVALCLHLNAPLDALRYAERARSRALLDMLTHHLDLHIEARTPEDEPIAAKLMLLQAERNRLGRHQEVTEDDATAGWIPSTENAARLQARLLALEHEITDLWHSLLVRNADYAREAEFWQPPLISPQEHLPEGTTLLEYFFIHDQIVLFVVNAHQIQHLILNFSPQDARRTLQLLQHNLRAAQRMPADHIPALTQNAQGLLQRLYQALLAPCEDLLQGSTHLVIVPHEVLHYLPFHAFFDGTHYLLERFTCSYLPAASLLPHCRSRRNPPPELPTLAAIGHSFDGRLPWTAEEARQVAALWHGIALTEKQATRQNLYALANQHQILHIAAHGEFRSETPLFSGLALEDGWLTALDVFQQHIRADLITLSACHTGRSVPGGGDELQGLLRAFLAGGTASVLVSLWQVPDSLTLGLNLSFYRALQQGMSRAAALCDAQRQVLTHPTTAHPCYWAAFALVGEWGALCAAPQDGAAET